MRFMKRILARWVREANNYDECLVAECVPSPNKITGSSRPVRSQGMDFSMYPANGGFIVEYHSYDRKRDETSHTLHVITEEQDLGQRVGEIVTIEMLRR